MSHIDALTPRGSSLPAPMSSASSDFLAPATSAIANTTLSHPPRAACSRLIHEGQLSVKKVASNRFISGSVWKKRYCVLNEFTTNTRKEKPSSSNANVITSSAINEHTIAGSEMDLPVGQGAVRPLNPDVLGELLIYKLPKRPSGPDDVLHDSITIRDSTLLVKETSKLPILHIVTQDGHDMATKSLQFDNAADLDSWVKGIQGMIDGLSADSDNVTDEPSTFATPFESTATAFSGAGTGLRPGGTSGEVDSASSKPSARPLSEGDKRNGAASPARLVSLAADIRSLSNRDGATLGVQSKPTSPSSNRKKSNASASSADAVAERKESERSNNNILKNSTPSMSGELGSANRAMRSLSAASDDSSAYRDYCDFDSSGASAWGIAAVADANRSEVRHASMFSTPVAAVEAIAMVPGGSSFGRDIPSSDSRPSRRGGPRSRGEIDMVVSSIARDNTDSAVIGEPGVIDAKSTRRGPSLRRGSNGNAVNTGKLAVAAKINTGGISTPGSAIPTLDSKLISSNDLRDTSSASDDMGISSPLFAASTPTVPTAADRLDVPALAAPRVDPGPHETPRVPLLGRLNVAGPDGLGISTEFGANSGGRLPVQNTSPADHSAIDMTRKKAEVGSTGVSPFDGFANTTLDSNPFPAIVTWSGHVKIGNNMPPAPSNASVPEPNPSQDEYSLYALELDALKQMNGELNDALLVQEKKFALETSNMSSKLRILSENEALLKAKCDGLERERAEWLATKALLSKQVIDLTGDAEKLRRENAGAVSGPAAAQVDSEHASVVRTLNAELTAARSETGRLKAELDEERVKCVALESKSVTIEETLRMREEELRDAELAVSDYKNQLDELRQRLRGSLSSKLDLQSRLSAEMHEELKGDTARMLSVEKEKAGLEASLAICRDELHILSKDNEDLRAKLTLKEMYVTALSKESQEGKIKYLEDELAHLRQEMPNIEAHKRRLADELGASQQSLFDERSKLLSLNEDCISLRSQLRQKESELSIVESDASNRTRHLTSEITRLNEDVALLTRQLESHKLSCEKSENALNEHQSRYINEKSMWNRSNSELQHSLDAAQSAIHSLQSRLATANDESKHEIARLTTRNKELEDTFEALNQSIGTLRQKLSTSEHRIETLQQSVANQSSALATLETTLSSNESSYKRDIDRYISKISELQSMVDMSQQSELEAKRRVSDLELQRCSDEMHMAISNQDLTSKIATLTKDLERYKEENTSIKTELTVLRAQSNDSIASLRNSVARLEDSKKSLERDLQDATQRLGITTRRSDEMTEELAKLTALAGEAVRTRVELEDANLRLASAQRRIEDLLLSETQLKETLKEAMIARGRAETQESETMRLYESARHDAEDLNKRWIEAQSLCDSISRERDEVRSECFATREALAELEARLVTSSRQCDEMKASNKLVAEQSLKRQRAIKKAQAALADVQVRLNETAEREARLREECNDLKTKLTASRMELEAAVSHAENLQASVDASRQDCSVLSEALMFAKTESSNLLSLKDNVNAELNCRIRTLEERLHELGCQMEGMVSKELHLKSEKEWRELSAHSDERFKEFNDQFSAAALILEGCCSRLSRCLIHDDLREATSKLVPDNRVCPLQNNNSPNTSPDARLRIALESVQQCADSVIEASAGASGAVASLLNYLIDSMESKSGSGAVSARGFGSVEDEALETSFDKISDTIDGHIDDVFGMSNIASLPYLGVTFKLIRENVPYMKSRSPRRAQGSNSPAMSPSASRPEISAPTMGLVMLAGSVKELSDLHMNAASRRKLEGDRIDAKKSEKYKNMKESLTAKIESMKRALEASQSSHESESEQWQAQVTALKSLVDSTISERDELRRENSSYAVRTAQMQTEIADLTTHLRKSASDLQRAECAVAQEVTARKEVELLLRRSIPINSALREASFVTDRNSTAFAIDPSMPSFDATPGFGPNNDDGGNYIRSNGFDGEAKDDGAQSSVLDASMPEFNDKHTSAISNAVTLVASHDGRRGPPDATTARTYSSSVDRHDEYTKSSSRETRDSCRSHEAVSRAVAYSVRDNAELSDDLGDSMGLHAADAKDEDIEELLTLSDRNMAESKSYTRESDCAVGVKEVKHSDALNSRSRSGNNSSSDLNPRRSNLRDWIEAKTEYKSQSSFRFISDSEDSNSEDNDSIKSPFSSSMNSHLVLKSSDNFEGSDSGCRSNREPGQTRWKHTVSKPAAVHYSVALESGDESSSSGMESPQAARREGLQRTVPQAVVPMDQPRPAAAPTGNAFANGSYLRSYQMSQPLSSASADPLAALSTYGALAVGVSTKAQGPIVYPSKDTADPKAATARLSLRERLNLHRGL